MDSHNDIEEIDEEEELGSEEIAERDYHDSPPMPDDKSVAAVMTKVNSDGSLCKVIRARRSDFVHNLIYLDGKKFSFAGRNYLHAVYNRDDKQVLLKTSRQVEKCQSLQDVVTLADGRRIASSNLRMGDRVVSFNGLQPTKGSISAIESNGVKRVVKITTKKKRSVTVTLNHPFRTLLGWTPAEQLSVGDFVALPHKAGIFGDLNAPLKAKITGHLLAEGHFRDDYVQFTQNPGANLDDFISSCLKYGDEASAKVFPSRPRVARVNVYKQGEVYNLADEIMRGRKSATLTLPEWLYGADEDTTREFLSSLWAGDGSCKSYTGTRNAIDLCYSSTSKVLIEGVQDLLLKFGIFTVIRENYPTLYKGTDKKAYILRVVDERSFKRFHALLGSIVGKDFSLDGHGGKDQSDIIPKKGLKQLLRQITRVEGKARNYGVNTLFKHGLHVSPGYNLQRNKFLKYCEILQDTRLWDIYDGEVYWDPIVSIEDAGEEETIAIEVEGYRNFITGGIVTHNTTFLANNLCVTSVVRPYSKALYVAPSHTQARQFSNEKLRPAIEKSPLIRKYFQDSSVSMQVFEKSFTNGSFVFLRSAFRSADRVRGISAETLCLDELQDYYGSEIPVIMECTSHFPNARVLMAGTPKSHDNPIELYWGTTTQNEWLVPCRSCGKRNFLDEDNIGPTDAYISGKLPPGPICRKCGKPIHPPDGEWVSFAKNMPTQGYRIPQLMVPWICGLYDQWVKLLWKRDQYPFGQFANEVLGLSYDSASKPISRDEIVECCKNYSLWNPADLGRCVGDARRLILTAGIDWGEGNDGSERSPTGKMRTASYSVLTIGSYLNQKTWRLLLAKKYQGREIDPDFVVRDIARICDVLGVKLIGADWGHGWGVNNHLVRLLGPKRVVQLQYLPKLKQKMKWDRIGMRYHLLRNFMMSEFFFDIKHHFVEFPRWAEFEPFAKDIMGIYSEYVEYRREIRYDHRGSDPDDTFHSLLYAKLTSDIYLGKSRRFTFDIENGIGQQGYIDGIMR